MQHTSTTQPPCYLNCPSRPAKSRYACLSAISSIESSFISEAGPRQVMSLTKTSLKNLAARVLISPPPVTLSESTAVLRRLQSFGPVTCFTRVVSPNGSLAGPQNTELGEAQVVFLSADTVLKACDASPFTVDVNQDMPDPQAIDPYNVRNFQARRQPRSNSLTCRVRLQEQDGPIPSGQNILSSGFSPSNKTRLYQSLLDVKPPPSIMDGLGVLETDRSHILSTAQLIGASPDLTSMYRSPPPDQLPSGVDGNLTVSALQCNKGSEVK